MKLKRFAVLILFNLVFNVRNEPIARASSGENLNLPINPEINPGMHEGDMLLTPNDSRASGRGVAIKPASSNRWPDRTIPYEFASNITVNNSAFIVSQMRQIELLTKVNNTKCITFRPRNVSDQYFITIFNGSGCYAPVGSWPGYTGVRPVSLMDSPSGTCMVTGIVQHELTHVLGFFHEQSRPDRDLYVSIQWSNIYPQNVRNFEKYNDSQVDTLNTSYDYGSVMHYDRYAFAIDRSLPTIIPTQNSSAYIGQRLKLSPIDILEIQRYYGCISSANILTNNFRSSFPLLLGICSLYILRFVCL